MNAGTLIEQFGNLKKNSDALKTMNGDKLERLREALDEQYHFVFR